MIQCLGTLDFTLRKAQTALKPLPIVELEDAATLLSMAEEWMMQAELLMGQLRATMAEFHYIWQVHFMQTEQQPTEEHPKTLRRRLSACNKRLQALPVLGQW